VVGKTKTSGGQWEDNPVAASWDIGTLSYAGMQLENNGMENVCTIKKRSCRHGKRETGKSAG
jgi:hypothetical protein